MNAPLAFPPIADAAPEPVKTTAIATIKATVLARLNAIETDLRALAEKYRAVVYDVKTPKGLADMKAARHDLRENGRFAVQRAEQAVKDEVNALKKDMGPAVERLIAIVQPQEDDFDKQIKAREAEIEAEKEAKRQAEAARAQKHRDGIERINAYVKQAQGLPSQRISNGIANLQAMQFGDEWEEFKSQAITARDSTLEALQALHDRTKAAEDDAARLEAQRLEQARVAKEQQAEADRLAAARAELERQQRAIIEAAEAEKGAEPLTAVEAYARRVDEASQLAVLAIATASAPKPGLAGVAQVLPLDPPPQVTVSGPGLVITAHDGGIDTQHPPQTFASVAPAPWESTEPNLVTMLDDLLAHIDKAFDTRFPSHPKPSQEWWSELLKQSTALREATAD